jgi:hypothetical protein
VKTERLVWAEPDPIYICDRCVTLAARLLRPVDYDGRERRLRAARAEVHSLRLALKDSELVRRRYMLEYYRVRSIGVALIADDMRREAPVIQATPGGDRLRLADEP